MVVAVKTRQAFSCVLPLWHFTKATQDVTDGTYIGTDATFYTFGSINMEGLV
jgi:hypothetical protein